MSTLEILHDMLETTELRLRQTQKQMESAERSLTWTQQTYDELKSRYEHLLDDCNKIKAVIVSMQKRQVTAELMKRHMRVNGNGVLVVNRTALSEILSEDEINRAVACVQDNINGDDEIDFVRAETSYYEQERISK